MAEIHQILDGMNELSERVQNLEARATEAERQAQATQQEGARTIASRSETKGRRVQQFHYNRRKGSARLRRSISLSR